MQTKPKIVPATPDSAETVETYLHTTQIPHATTAARTYERQEASALSTSSSGDSYPPSVSPRKPSREARPCKLHDILAVPNRGLFGAVPRQPATRRWTAGESVQRIGTMCLAPMKPQSLAASARKAR